MWPFSRKKKKEKKVGVAAGTITTKELEKAYGFGKKKRKVTGTKTRRISSTKPNKCTGGTRGTRGKCRGCSDGPGLLDTAIAYEFVDELLDDDNHSGCCGSCEAPSVNYGSYRDSDSGSYDSGSSDCSDSDDF